MDDQQDVAAPGGAEDSAGHVDGNNSAPFLVGRWPQWPSVIQRYYSTHTTSNHQCLHVHSNGVCVLSVAPTHPMLQPPLRVTDIAYRSHDSKNLMQTSASVHGKRKAGAHFLVPRDMVCTVTLSDQSTVTLYACVRASVIEINHRLIDQPELLGTPEGCVFAPCPLLCCAAAAGQPQRSRRARFPALSRRVRAALARVVSRSQLKPVPVFGGLQRPSVVLARFGSYVAVLLPKLDEKKSIGDACDEFDRSTPLAVESTNSKRKADGRPACRTGTQPQPTGGGEGDLVEPNRPTVHPRRAFISLTLLAYDGF